MFDLPQNVVKFLGAEVGPLGVLHCVDPPACQGDVAVDIHSAERLTTILLGFVHLLEAPYANQLCDFETVGESIQARFDQYLVKKGVILFLSSAKARKECLS